MHAGHIQSFIEKEEVPQDNPPSITSSKQPFSSQLSGVTSLPAPISPQITQIVQQMKNTLDIRDRCFNNKMYSTCFSAMIVIDWLLMNGYVDSRKEGIRLCQDLLSSQIIISLTSPRKEFHVG